MSNLSDFRYVDFATRALRQFRNNVVPVSQVPELARRYGRIDCFCTYLLFDEGLPDYVRQNGRSVSSYQGPCYAHYLPLDMDAPNFGDTLEAARGISAYLLDHWGMLEEGLATYYSGMKGFHLTIPTRVFGDVEHGADLPRAFRELRRNIVKRAKPEHAEAVDFAICDRLRLLRLPNTRHSKSSLYKVPMRIEELMTCEPDEIRCLARKPRVVWLTDDTGLLPRYQVEPVPEAVEMFAGCAERASEKARGDLPDPEASSTEATFPPPSATPNSSCIEKACRKGRGRRWRCALRAGFGPPDMQRKRRRACSNRSPRGAVRRWTRGKWGRSLRRRTGQAATATSSAAETGAATHRTPRSSAGIARTPTGESAGRIRQRWRTSQDRALPSDIPPCSYHVLNCGGC